MKTILCLLLGSLFLLPAKALQENYDVNTHWRLMCKEKNGEKTCISEGSMSPFAISFFNAVFENSSEPMQGKIEMTKASHGYINNTMHPAVDANKNSWLDLFLVELKDSIAFDYQVDRLVLDNGTAKYYFEERK